MSFDANPFSDPFADRDVSRVRGSTKVTDPIDDFNPFANDQFASQQSAVLPTASVNEPPPYNSSSSAAVAAATEDLRRRQEELDRKAEEIERRERSLQQNAQPNARLNNFPPLPICCPVKPCFQQDFALDIPAEFRKLVRFMYFLWIAYVCVLFINIAACLAYFIGSSRCANIYGGGTSFGLSIVYFVIWSPLSYVCWFRPVYNAFRSDSSFYFFLFFFIFFIQGCTCIIQCLGIEGSGTVGYLSGLGMTNCNPGISIFMLVIGAMFTVLAVLCFILLIRIHRYYRASGASFTKAQEEFAQGIVTNRTVQQTTANVAGAAARNAVNQYSGGYDSRY